MAEASSSSVFVSVMVSDDSLLLLLLRLDEIECKLDRIMEELRTPTAIGYSVRQGNRPRRTDGSTKQISGADEQVRGRVDATKGYQPEGDMGEAKNKHLLPPPQSFPGKALEMTRNLVMKKLLGGIALLLALGSVADAAVGPRREIAIDCGDIKLSFVVADRSKAESRSSCRATASCENYSQNWILRLDIADKDTTVLTIKNAGGMPGVLG